MNLPCVFVFDVLNRATAFDTANSKTGGVSETIYDSSLPFQRALQGLIELERVLQVYDIDVSVCGADDQQ